MKKLLTLALLTILLAAAAPLQATYNLVIFNNPTLAADSDLEFTVDVLANGSDKADFIFKNISIMDSTIASVYFDTDLLSAIDSIINGTGTEFETDSSPGNLPAGNTIGFDTALSAGALPPPAKYGIDPTEQITITCNLSGSFADLISQLDSGASRIGAHIISVGCNEVSVSAATPEPATIALLGLGAFSLLKRRK